MARNPIGKTATSIRPVNGWTSIKYHDTDVVSFSGSKIVVLNSGGWLTPTTKRRMNETSDEYALGYKVYAKGGTRKEPKWFVDTPFDGTIEFFDGVRFQGGRKTNPKRKRTVAKKRRTAKQIAATRKLVAFNKKRRKKTGRKRTVGRKKTKRRVVRRKKTKRNPQKARPGLKKSHLWIVFKCAGNSVYFMTLRAGKLAWTLTKGDAIFFKTKSHAKSTGAKVRVKSNWSLGIAPDNETAATIAADCRRTISGK